jgi:hypothetical protein
MRKSNERSIKPFTAAYGFLGWLCPFKVTFRRFSVPGRNFKITHGIIPNPTIQEDDLLRLT